MRANRPIRSRIRPVLLCATLIPFSCTQPADPASATPPVEVAAAGHDLRVSGPYTHDNLELFLVHSKDQHRTGREILTLEEAMQRKLAVVHETGEVQELAIENLSKDADIFVQSGDIVQGGKQDRVLAKDLLVAPGSGKVALASFCVEQGRWSPRGVGLAGGEADSRATLSGGMSLSFSSSSNALSSKELKRAVKLSAAQQEVWDSVQLAQGKLVNNTGAAAVSELSASSLELTLGSPVVQKSIEAYEKALAKILEGKQDVVGFAFAINGELNSAEVYANSDLFHKLWRKNLQACSVEAVSVADQRPEKPKPTELSAVKAFLAVGDAPAKSELVNPRMQLVTVDTPERAFQESRDRQASGAWIHRSYLKR